MTVQVSEFDAINVLNDNASLHVKDIDGFDRRMIASVFKDKMLEPLAAADSDTIVANQQAKKYFATFDNVAEMQASVTEEYIGRRVQWLGYYAVSDGGSGWGIVKSGAHTADGGSIITVNASLYIEQNLNSTVNVRKFGANPSQTDNSPMIQAAIDFCLAAVPLNDDPYQVLSSKDVRIPQGKYDCNSTIRMGVSGNQKVCSITGTYHTQLNYTGATGNLLHIGNSTAFGIYPAVVKRLTLSKPDIAAGSAGLYVENASNGQYTEISTRGFAVGVYNKGSINCTYDFKRRPIVGAQQGFVAENSPNTGGGLRFDSNLLHVKGAIFRGGTVDGFVLRSGGISGGTGGLIKLEYCTFEGVLGKSLVIENAGELANFDEFVVDHCWFEYYGNFIADIFNSRVKFKNCFFTGTAGTQEGIQLNDNASVVVLEDSYAYFADHQPASGALVKPATGLTLLPGQVISRDSRKDSTSTMKISPWSGPISFKDNLTRTKAIFLDSRYPTGNNDANHNLNLNMVNVLVELFGSLVTAQTRGFCDFTIIGSDGSGIGAATYRLYIAEVGGVTRTMATAIVAGTGLTLSGTTIVFPASGGDWTSSILHVTWTDVSFYQYTG